MARNKKANGEIVSNEFSVSVAKDGTCSYNVSDRIAFAKMLCNENVSTSLTHFVTLTSGWNKFGYSTIAAVKLALFDNAITNLSKDVSSVASGTSFTSLYNFDIATGTYILNITVVWASNATGRRCAGLSTNTSTTNQGYHMVDNQAAVNGAKTFCHMTQVIKLTSATTYYVLGYQNSGSALGAEIRVNYIKLI